ncbi:hypothetical protein [Mesorhizobium sp. WSM2239]|uniref:DUF5076 domain-containing protein n=2 Tax=unclassified Mesorhizobium TaxID=325217 RepID=A0AAU8DH54_9HYPH
MSKLPEFIRFWTAPFHVTMDGIKDANGCWICSAANNKLAHELVELMNFAARAHHALTEIMTYREDVSPLTTACQMIDLAEEVYTNPPVGPSASGAPAGP